ncbi:HRDC domain-containing protein [Paenibacillus sp. MMS20-IR301]|uniref:HRDC domain-containing protein n=1 Tax=Paenibacillus sp. MMS20-IR301 TaxID=2895946 RepID=UPI0028EDF65F|nr:HRDC domain-containing protein [Paenibacillus sp. MMS20-IR301]WNS46547.1 HRDC domain-containing protein [Paenibacillus sp. MMS20-IR301]
MQIVFMNRLSRLSEVDREVFAQLWIGEEEGVWRLGWRDFSGAQEMGDSLWYEGSSWNEMLCVYRHELAVKMGEGYRPLIDGVFHEEEHLGGRSQEQLKLQYYSEQHAADAVYDELCSWRRGKASSERKAPYVLASNRLLRMISAFLPHTTEELLQIPGVGEGKASQYGADWLQITSGIQRAHSFPLSWVNEAIDEEGFVSWLYKQKELKYKKQLERLRLRRVLLQAIEAGQGMEQIRALSGISRREILEAAEELEKDGYSVEKLITFELSEVSPLEQNNIWTAYELMGDTFLKPVLYKAYGEDFAPAEGLDMYYERLRLIRLRFRREQPVKLGLATNL